MTFHEIVLRGGAGARGRSTSHGLGMDFEKVTIDETVDYRPVDDGRDAYVYVRSVSALSNWQSVVPYRRG